MVEHQRVRFTLRVDDVDYFVASPPDRPPTIGGPAEEEDTKAPVCPEKSYGKMKKGQQQQQQQGSLTIVRRSSGKKGEYGREGPDDAALEAVDLATENLPAVDTPDACDKAALRLRALLRQLQHGEISADLLSKNLMFAVKVLETVYIDETKEPRKKEEEVKGDTEKEKSKEQPTNQLQVQRRLRTPVWASRRLADDDDELSEVQPDAVPPEVREWLTATFTRQVGPTKRRSEEKPKFKSVAHAIRAGIFVDRIYRRVTSSALMQFPPSVVKVLKTLDDWSFDVFALNEATNRQPIKYLTYDLLNRYGLFHKFKMVPSTLENFLTRIEEGYCKYRNPYHNNLHAADVAQTVHYMLCQTGLMNWLTDLEIFATLVAALIHDFEHTGTTNNFHVMSGTETALLYNDRAVLENHHISAAFRLLKEEDCNILQSLSAEEYREFRSLVIDMVLATDMSFHFQQLKNMKSILSLGENKVDKSKVLSLVLHCCDISHPAKRWDLHHRWTTRLLEEFFRQGDMERELGLPFSPLCDRNNTMIAESQIGFIDFIVEPSMGVCSDMLELILTPQPPTTTATTTQPPQGATDIGSNVPGPSKSENKTAIKKPWVNCLVENKRIWKEKALHETAFKKKKETAEESEDQPTTNQKKEEESSEKVT
ncbi:dual specificity calcium/calmodulin-dependent 3',5'-cyclic nucleotide phosphodiesterase 1 isoform X2 [Halyomorpha halys]|uniref:dual specificity calcium/calmodulin-dependent 3',5'-cyclic nucleotide phosphodiesterase 1 isoform X2 n=1 Tax=Halyomorpha halys TaxID=286706 RepID=UPI0006D51E3B